MEEEKKVNEEPNEVEETVEEVAAPAVVPETPKKKGFFHIPTKEEKRLAKAEKLQRKIERDSLELVVAMEPDDEDSAARLAQMKREDLVTGVKKTGTAILAVVGVAAGGLYVASKVLRKGGTDDAVDTTFEEVSVEESSEEN